MNTGKMSATLVAIVAWLTVILQLFITTSKAMPGEMTGDIINLFSYFTVISNTLIAITMTLASFRTGGLAHSALWRGAIALYITVVALVFHIVLAPTVTFEGLSVYANIGLHSVVPVLYLIDWVFFAPKSTLHIKDPLKWLTLPILYCIYSMGRGEMVGWHPYFFLDPNESSYSGVALNILGLIILFYIFGMIVFYLSKKLPWPGG